MLVVLLWGIPTLIVLGSGAYSFSTIKRNARGRFQAASFYRRECQRPIRICGSMVWKVLKQAVQGFIDHGALSRGAAIAFYTVTSLAPLLLIVIAIAGLAIGRDAARAGVIDDFPAWSARRAPTSSNPSSRAPAIRHPERPPPCSAPSWCW